MVAMRERSGFANLNEQSQPLREAGFMQRAVFGDRAAFDVFHDHVQAAIFSDATVVQTRDSRMFQSRQNLPLCLKALRLAGRFSLQQLDGDALLEFPIGANGLVNVAHAAASDQSSQTPRPEADPDR